MKGDTPYRFVIEGENGSASVTMRDNASPISAGFSRCDPEKISDLHRQEKLGVFQFRGRKRGGLHWGNRLLVLSPYLWTIKNQTKSDERLWIRRRMGIPTVTD